MSLIYPEVPALLKPDGTWDEAKEPMFKFRYQVKDAEGNVISESIHDSLDDIPSASFRLKAKVGQFIEHWTDELRALRPRESVSVFQLDPNQLLSVSDGFKIVLRRPLPI